MGDSGLEDYEKRGSSGRLGLYRPHSAGRTSGALDDREAIPLALTWNRVALISILVLSSLAVIGQALPAPSTRAGAESPAIVPDVSSSGPDPTGGILAGTVPVGSGPEMAGFDGEYSGGEGFSVTLNAAISCNTVASRGGGSIPTEIWGRSSHPVAPGYAVPGAQTTGFDSERARPRRRCRAVRILRGESYRLLQVLALLPEPFARSART